jgi:hypothetical protein
VYCVGVISIRRQPSLYSTERKLLSEFIIKKDFVSYLKIRASNYKNSNNVASVFT